MTKQDVEKEVRKLKAEAEKALKGFKEKAPKGLFKRVAGVVVLVLVIRAVLKRLKTKKIPKDTAAKKASKVTGGSRRLKGRTSHDCGWDARR